VKTDSKIDAVLLALYGAVLISFIAVTEWGLLGQRERKAGGK
jgi:hypothetical protein